MSKFLMNHAITEELGQGAQDRDTWILRKSDKRDVITDASSV